MRAAAKDVTGVDAVSSLTVQTDPSRLELSGEQVQGFVVMPGEVLDLRLAVDIAPSP